MLRKSVDSKIKKEINPELKLITFLAIALRIIINAKLYNYVFFFLINNFVDSYLNAYLSQIYGEFLKLAQPNNEINLNLLLLKGLLSAITIVLCHSVRQHISIIISYEIKLIYSKKVLDSFSNMSFVSFLKYSDEQKLALYSYVEQIGLLYREDLTSLIDESIKLVFIIFFIFKTNALLSFFVVISFIPYFILARKMHIKWRYYGKLKSYNDIVKQGLLLDKLKLVAYLINKIYPVQGSNVTDIERDSYNLAKTRLWNKPIVKHLFRSYRNLNRLFFLYVLGLLLISNRINISSIVVFLSLFNKTETPFDRITNQIKNIVDRQIKIERLFFYLKENKLESEEKKAKKTISMINTIEFKNVSFGYSDSQPNEQLNNANLKINCLKKEKIAIIGPSGAGKTTISYLLMGLLKSTKGNVLINDIPLEEIDKDCFYKLFGIVTQEAFFFHTTVEKNFNFDGINKLNDKEILEYIKSANYQNFSKDLLQKIPNGKGKNAHSFSGGESKRLSIARALAKEKECDFLLLDEPLSGLDPKTAQQISHMLFDLPKSTLTITHHYFNLKQYDKVFKLEDRKLKFIAKEEYSKIFF